VPNDSTLVIVEEGRRSGLFDDRNKKKGRIEKKAASHRNGQRIEAQKKRLGAEPLQGKGKLRLRKKDGSTCSRGELLRRLTLAKLGKKRRKEEQFVSTAGERSCHGPPIL